MTRDELHRLVARLRRFGLSHSGVRAQLEAAIVELRAQGGRYAQLAEAFSAALRDHDEQMRAIDPAYVLNVYRMQSTQN
jgi:hypothetical protein